MTKYAWVLLGPKPPQPRDDIYLSYCTVYLPTYLHPKNFLIFLGALHKHKHHARHQIFAPEASLETWPEVIAVNSFKWKGIDKSYGNSMQIAKWNKRSRKAFLEGFRPRLKIPSSANQRCLTAMAGSVAFLTAWHSRENKIMFIFFKHSPLNPQKSHWITAAISTRNRTDPNKLKCISQNPMYISDRSISWPSQKGQTPGGLSESHESRKLKPAWFRRQC